MHSLIATTLFCFKIGNPIFELYVVTFKSREFILVSLLEPCVIGVHDLQRLIELRYSIRQLSILRGKLLYVPLLVLHGFKDFLNFPDTSRTRSWTS